METDRMDFERYCGDENCRAELPQPYIRCSRCGWVKPSYPIVERLTRELRDETTRRESLERRVDELIQQRLHFDATIENQIDTLTRERDEALAALACAERAIQDAMQFASKMNLNGAGCILSAYQLTGRDYALILAARDERMKREGGIEELLTIQEAYCAAAAKHPMSDSLKLDAVVNHLCNRIAALEAKG